MIRDKDTIEKKLKTVLSALEEVANEDNVITDDEAAILKRVTKDIEEMESQLFQVLNSNLDEEDFNELAGELLHALVYNATKTAMADEVLTEDENRLLKKLEELIKGDIFNE